MDRSASLSGVDGTLLHSFSGIEDTRFGHAVSSAGDVDADGFADVVVGAWNSYARVFSGLSGSILHHFTEPNTCLGRAVAGPGDVDGDGFDDILIGLYCDDTAGASAGSARLLSGADGSTLLSFFGDTPVAHFGVAVSGAGDVTGDGIPDLIVGASGDGGPNVNAGSAQVFSGLDGGVLYTFEGQPGDFLGSSVSGGGDVDGDGFADFIIGIPVLVFSTTKPGRTTVHSGVQPSLLGDSYCTPAIPNSMGQPALLFAYGSAIAAANNVSLIAQQLPPGQFGYFLTSQTQGLFTPPGSQGYICLAGNIGRYDRNVGQGPSFSLQLDLTSMPVNPPQAVVPGDTWNFQAWYRDVGNTNNLTDAVSITFN